MINWEEWEKLEEELWKENHPKKTKKKKDWKQFQKEKEVKRIKKIVTKKRRSNEKTNK